MTTRVRKHKPGRITFVGSGPGDPGLLTTRARNVLAHAALVFTDPDVPEAVLALIGTDLPPTSGPHPADAEPAETKPDEAPADKPAAPAMTFPHGVDVRPALGDPTEVAKLLIAEAKPGVDVVPPRTSSWCRACRRRRRCRPTRACPSVRRTPWPMSAVTSTGPRWPLPPGR